MRHSIKKIAVSAVAAGFIFGSALPALAETTSSTSTSALVQTLEQQIIQLQAQLKALQSAQADVVGTSAQIAETAKLLRSLREGMSGDDVKTLQAILAKYPDVYPEGLITGYFGKATVRAVKRFQARENIESIGLVGPKTLAKLLKELERDPLGHEDDDDDEDRGKGMKRPCALIPPGHLVAPGWLRKHSGDRPIVPLCQKLPPGIKEQLDGTKGTTTPPGPDIVAPIVSSIFAGNISQTAARVFWMTNEKATSKVWYSTVSPVSATGTTPSVASSERTKVHDLQLTGLVANTTYFYVVESSDEAGNTTVSAQFSFVTAAVPPVSDTTAPAISNVSVGSIASTSAHILWTTSESADGKVWYGTATPVASATTSVLTSSADFVTGHDLTLSSLTASSTYFYLIVSKDVAGNTATSSEASFVTLTQ